MQVIELSVHQLVDFVLRKGDIDNRFFNQETMLEGTRLHAIYQSKQGESYLKEVPLTYDINFGEFVIRLSGRADGIILEDTPVIDEIKTTNGDLNIFFEKNKDWHLGQAICYAYMYSCQKNIDYIGINLTYISQIDSKQMFKRFFFTKNELLSKIYSYLNIFLDFYKILIKRVDHRNESLKNKVFPFEKLRSGQEEMIEAVKDSYINHKYYFIEASTGIGKTMSAIYGSLEGLEKGVINKVFYLTPKNSGFINSFKALKILNDKNIFISAVELLGKEKMCPHKGNKNCNPDDCPLTRDYYNKINVALKEIIIKEEIITSNIIHEYAKKYMICPFELSLDVSLYTDFVVCDYNFAFHPIALLKRFFDNPITQYRKLALIDEAHNFINRARDMYSASFYSKFFESMKKALKEAKKENKELARCLRELSKDVKSFKEFEYDDKNYFILETLDNHFIRYLRSLDKEIKDYMSTHPNFKNKEIETFSRENFKFIKMLELLNSDFKIILKKEDNGFTINLFCMNPAPFIKEKMSNFEGAVLFSATFSPLDYFETLLLESPIYDTLSLPSPFDKNNLRVLVNNSISIKYKDRLLTLNEVVKEILTFVDFKVGNYIIFAPSFEYLNNLKSLLIKDDRFVFQDKNMTKEDKDNFLDYFKENPTKTRVGVCVMGGSFSEGIDLVGDRLIGVIIIGVSLSTVSVENDLLNDYFTSKGLSGYEYAYINPGISRIMQAVGRLIRKESDRGVALLIDNRYLFKRYSFLFKEKWTNYSIVKNSEDITLELRNFYN